MLDNVLKLRYKDKVVIVTGGTSGIGEGIALKFVKEGANVVACSIEDEKGMAMENNLESQEPGTFTFVFCDLNMEEHIKNLINETLKRFGRIDCLVNNAGCHPPHKSIDQFSSEEFRNLFSINVMAYFLTSKYALPHLRKTSGNIINISSLVNWIGQPEAVTYCATKGAITAMTKALAIDEAIHRVRVNAISPGNVFTPMWQSVAMECGNFEKVVESGMNAQLLGRFGTTEECGDLCLFLAAEATFMTGVDIPFSGGAELKILIDCPFHGFRKRNCYNEQWKQFIGSLFWIGCMP